MKWFKFYGQDYLSDPKILALSASERSCWVTLLSYGSVDDNGMITFLNEEQLKIQAGISPAVDEWDATTGILMKLEKLKMIRNDNGVIIIINWNKRQEKSLTPYERVKRYRARHKNDNADDNSMITLDKNRVDKKRIKDTVSFNEFWEEYPRHVNKLKASIIWNKLDPDTSLKEKILSSIRSLKITPQWTKDNGQFIPHPTTYLNGRRWEDEANEPKDESWKFKQQ